MEKIISLINVNEKPETNLQLSLCLSFLDKISKYWFQSLHNLY